LVNNGDLLLFRVYEFEEVDKNFSVKEGLVVRTDDVVLSVSEGKGVPRRLSDVENIKHTCHLSLIYLFASLS